MINLLWDQEILIIQPGACSGINCAEVGEGSHSFLQHCANDNENTANSMLLPWYHFHPCYVHVQIRVSTLTNNAHIFRFGLNMCISLSRCLSVENNLSCASVPQALPWKNFRFQMVVCLSPPPPPPPPISGKISGWIFLKVPTGWHFWRNVFVRFNT